MAITQYTEPATVNPSLTDWQNSIARDNASSRGFAEVDLDDYDDGATAPKVAVGSRFDNNGALYVVSGADESATGIAAIANSTTFYIYYDVSEGEFLASTTAPTFDKEKRGWYNGNDRALFTVYKDSSGNYDQRRKLIQENDGIQVYTGDDKDNTDFPIGTCLIVYTGVDNIDRNSVKDVYINGGTNTSYTVVSGGAQLTGTWVGRGRAIDAPGPSYYYLCQRIL